MSYEWIHLDVECWLLYSLYVDFIQVWGTAGVESWGAEGTRAGELGARLVSSHLVLSRLVSSRLVWGDEVGSGEYQVMGLRCRNFIFPFAILHTYPYGQRGEGLEACKDRLVVG